MGTEGAMTALGGELISTGQADLDGTILGLSWGDNVVFLVERPADYATFARAFVEGMLGEGRGIVYVRFAPHPPLLAERPGVEIVAVDPGSGFDVFSAQIHRLIERHGERISYVFDNLSALVEPWATDELVANFFPVTCPYLHELETIAYFALSRGSHANDAVARVAATTQVLIDIYRVDGRMYVHPIKVWGRYTPRMFLPQRVDEGNRWSPVLRTSPERHPEGHDGDALSVLQPGSAAPWNSVYARLARSRTSPDALGSPEVAALKAELRRMLVGDDPSFARLADRYLTVDDLLQIRERLIGSGRIGGKASGMLLARRILLSDGADDPSLAGVLEEHDSFYVGSDVFFTFLVENGLFRRRLEVYRQEDLSRERFEELEAAFLAGQFPPAIVEAFRATLEHYGEDPIIVRSSSFLEDGFGHSFAGKYYSEFCPNQGALSARLEAFMTAVKRVYASALSPDALTYRRRHGLVEPDEQMAILVQRVSGSRYKRYFFPSLAGVAFSRNIYPWSDRIDPARGMIRLVFGLGTRAVDRVEDYPRIVAIGAPDLRPESGREVARYSQHRVDLVDLAANRFVSLPLEAVIADRDYPQLHLFVSEMRDGFPYDPPGNLLQGRPQDLVLTFNNLLRRTDLIATCDAILSRLERAYGRPVDIEFTARLDGGGRVRLNLLQCRPMSLPGWAPGGLPEDIPDERIVFRADRMAGAGLVRDIGHVIYVDPRGYNVLDLGLKRGLGRVVGRLNRHPRLAGARLMLVGPGRWGSSNIALGVNVTYADIDRASVLVEVAREEAGQLPEVSYGTHFFQDLVEDRIIYIAVYPDDARSRYAAAFFGDAPSVARELVPEAAAYEGVLKVIDVAAHAGGRLAHVAADPDARRAVCYLE